MQREVGTFISPALLDKFFDLVEDPEAEASDRAPDECSVRRTVFIRGFTPMTGASTHVFSWIARNYELGDSSVTERLRSMDAELLRQDSEVVQRLQRHTDRYGPVAPGALANSDLASIKTAEIVRDMLTRERPPGPHSRVRLPQVRRGVD